MLILLPPSEAKTRPPATDGHPALDLDALALPQLRQARGTMLRAVQRTATGQRAAEQLGVPASSPELVARMAGIAAEPVAAPLRVYSGVLFDQLDPTALPGPDRRVLIQSALFGVVDAARDRIPAYRLSAGSTLARLGKAATWWARHLRPLAAQLLAETAAGDSPVVLDARSGAYRAMMPLRSAAGAPVLEVAPVQERAGVRTVISHDAKRHRGWVTRTLLEAPTSPSTPDEVIDQLRARVSGTLGIELDGHRLVVVDRAD